MNLNWSNTIIKYVLFVFNFLFVISGIIMIAVGVSVKTYYKDYDVFLDDKYFSLPNLLIATGSLIFFISFLGCCGAYRESWFMIFVFSVLLALIFILEFSAGIAGYVLRDKTSDYLKTTLQHNIEQYRPQNKTTNIDDITKMWDIIQVQFECCGAIGPDDWEKLNITVNSTVLSTQSAVPTQTTPSTQATPATSASTQSTPAPSASTQSTPSAPPSTQSTLKPAPNDTKTGDNHLISKRQAENTNKEGEEVKKTYLLPASCCKNNYGIVGQVQCSKNSPTATPYSRGCVDGFGKYLKEHAVTIGAVGLAIGFIQLFGVVFACHLSKQIKHGFYST